MTERGVVRASSRIASTSELSKDFEAFYRRNYSSVRGFLLKGGADQTEAEDATQNAMTALLERWSGIRAHAAWVRTTARNDWLKAKIRERETPCLDTPGDSQATEPVTQVDPSTPEESIHRQLQQDATVSLLHQLPPTQRACFALVLDGYTTHEIASLTGKTEAVVRSNVAHARRRLRRHIAAHATRAGASSDTNSVNG